MQQKLVLAILFSLFALTYTLNNGVALTPGMGWNSWNHFGCDINEQTITDTVDQLVKTGLRDKGYIYVNLDDCWQISRNATTNVIQPDAQKFPKGIQYLTQYAHANGLKLGLYSDAGTHTCQGRPGSLGYEEIDAQTYASWEVDYLKYDNCYDNGTSPTIRYPPMRDALNKTGRKIYFSMCEWGVDQPWTWASPVGNSWRTTGDISDNWNSFVSILDQNAGLYNYSSIGGWNDPDMLEVGNGGMTTNEYQAHFALWALLKAPLLIGCDLEKMSDDTLNILGNEEVIAVNQDKLGLQGQRVLQNKTNQTEVWAGKLDQNQIAVVLLNRNTVDLTISFKFSDVFYTGNNAYLRDLINKKDLGKYTQKYETKVSAHSVVMLKLTPTSAVFLE